MHRLTGKRCCLQLGYLLTIPVSQKMKEEQNFDVDGLEFVVS